MPPSYLSLPIYTSTYAVPGRESVFSDDAGKMSWSHRGYVICARQSPGCFSQQRRGRGPSGLPSTPLPLSSSSFHKESQCKEQIDLDQARVSARELVLLFCSGPITSSSCDLRLLKYPLSSLRSHGLLREGR